MKIRNGFVSNSSSSSFIIAVVDLLPWDIRHNKNNKEKIEFILDKVINEASEEGWAVRVENGYLFGTTWMDNFDLIEYITKITDGVSQYDFITFPAHSGFNHGDIEVLRNVVKHGFHNLDHTLGKGDLYEDTKWLCE